MEFIYFFFCFDTVIVDWKKYWQLPIFPEGDILDNSPFSLWNAQESVKKTQELHILLIEYISKCPQT